MRTSADARHDPRGLGRERRRFDALDDRLVDRHDPCRNGLPVEVAGPLGLLPLPSKWYIQFGEPISTADYEDGAADDPMVTFELTDQVRATIQQTLYQLLANRRGTFL